MLEKNNKIWVSFILLIFISFMVIDIIEDLQQGLSLGHVMMELFMVLLCLIGFIILWGRYLFMKEENRVITQNLSHLHQEMEKYRKETKSLAKGLAIKIDEQLDQWKLTKAEKEVSLLLLKGLDFKEIAEVRSTSEKTIRQQASSIYQKSKLGGRSELSAFFLEDILFIEH